MTAKLTRLRSLLRETIRELGVRSQLHDVGLTKAEIRALSREMGLPTAEKPSFACLASLDLQGGIAGPLLTTPGADFDDDHELAARAGYVVGSKRTTSS